MNLHFQSDAVLTWLTNFIGITNFPLDLLEVANRILNEGFGRLYSIDFESGEVTQIDGVDLEQVANDIERFEDAISFPETIMNFLNFRVVLQALFTPKTPYANCKKDYLIPSKCKISSTVIKDR